MPDSRIINDMSANYLLVTSTGNDGSGYEHKMFEYNQIKGFLPFSVSRINNHLTYQYQIMEMDNLAKAYFNRAFNVEDIKCIFSAISMAGQMAAEYLLNTDAILLSPEYIFTNGTELFFCYYPGNETSFNRGIRELMEYILERLNHEHQENVMLAYGLYQKVLKNAFTMEMLMEEFTKPKEKIPEPCAEKNIVIIQDKKCYEVKPQGEDLQEKEVEKAGKMADIIQLEEELEKERLEKPERKKKTQKNKGNFLFSFSRKKRRFQDEKKEEGGNTMLLAEHPSYGGTQLLSSKRLVNQGDGRDILLCNFPIHIGNQSGDAECKIDNIMVSRNHAVVTWECGVYYVEDCDSTNGTFVNGSRIPAYEPVQVREGDSISFANETYCLN